MENNQKQVAKIEDLFSYNENHIRNVVNNDEYWWFAGDVCKVLEISNPSQAVSRLDDYEKAIYTVYTLGGQQKALFVNESGLYSLIFTSRKKEAKEFKKWVTTEVLPSIRKTGSYSTDEKRIEEMIQKSIEKGMKNILYAFFKDATVADLADTGEE